LLVGAPHSYEPVSIYLSTRTYTPDFFVPTLDRLVEVKGWVNRRFSEIAIQLAAERPDIDIALIGPEQYAVIKKHPELVLDVIREAPCVGAMYRQV
jgi:hypothetical protein